MIKFSWLFDDYAWTPRYESIPVQNRWAIIYIGIRGRSLLTLQWGGVIEFEVNLDIFWPPLTGNKENLDIFWPPSPGDHPPNAPLIKTNPLRSKYKNSRKSVNVVRINMFNTSKCIRISRGTHWWGCACAWEIGKCIYCVNEIFHFSFSRFSGSCSVVRRLRI